MKKESYIINRFKPKADEICSIFENKMKGIGIDKQWRQKWIIKNY